MPVLAAVSSQQISDMKPTLSVLVFVLIVTAGSCFLWTTGREASII